MARGVMALDDDQFENVAARIGNDGSILHTRTGNDLSGYNLVRDDLNNSDLSFPISANLKITVRAIPQVHRAARLGDGGGVACQIFPIFGDEHALFVSLANAEILEVIEDDEVGPVARR